MRKSSFLKMMCIVFIFCVMTAVASLAQTLTTRIPNQVVGLDLSLVPLA